MASKATAMSTVGMSATSLVPNMRTPAWTCGKEGSSERRGQAWGSDNPLVWHQRRPRRHPLEETTEAGMCHPKQQSSKALHEVAPSSRLVVTSFPPLSTHSVTPSTL